MGELRWRMYLEYYKYSCWPGSNPDHIPIDLDCTIALPPPFPTLSTMLDEHVTTSVFGFLDESPCTKHQRYQGHFAMH